MKSFSISEALSAAWNCYKTRAWFFIGVLLLLGVLSAIPQLILNKVSTDSIAESGDATIFWVAIVLGISLQLFQYFLWLGVLRITLTVVDGGEGSFGELFSCGPVFISYVLAKILYSLIGVVGLLLLVVPGIIWYVLASFYSLSIVDRQLGPVESLKASAALTKGVRWKLFGFALVLGILNGVGLLLVAVGLLVTIPVTLLANVFVYRKLLSQTQFA